MSLLAAVACGPHPQARADTAATSSRSSGGEVDQQPEAPKKDTGAAKDSTKKDSSELVAVKVAPGRLKKDSLALVSAVTFGTKAEGWPVRGPAPLAGSILPQKRIVAFYGNPLSKKMGILGALPPDQMLKRLDEVAAEWQKDDPDTPVQTALHYIAVVAQAGPGSDGKYRLRMDSAKIEEIYGWAQQKNALLFLDIQTGQSTVMEELPRLMKFLERPNVHLGIDPEFHMHYGSEGVLPGKAIGTLSSKEVNFAIDQLGKLVTEKNLPPKVLVVHRFTRQMLRGSQDIKLDPRVQVVVNMDGWGAPWLKFDSYKAYIVKEPVQFTGFKLFFGNDTKKGDRLLLPMEVLQLKPRPLYIQYQ